MDWRIALSDIDLDDAEIRTKLFVALRALPILRRGVHGVEDRGR